MKHPSFLFRFLLIFGTPLIIGVLCMMRPVFGEEITKINITPEQYYIMAVKHYNGQGVKKDPMQAVKYYEEAAKQGHIKAQFNLGLMLFEGFSIPKNQKQGAYWLLKAAEQGEPKAQYQIGCAYLEGKGVEKELTHALNWLQKSADQGNPDAANALKLILTS